MYRLFVVSVRQRQRPYSFSVHQPPPALVQWTGSSPCRLLECSASPFTQSPSTQLTHALTRSLVSSSGTKPRPTHSPTIPLPALPPTSTPSVLTSASSLLSPVLQPIFGRHTTPLRLLSLLSLAFLCHLFIFDLFTGHGPSMLPTFAMSGEVFLVEAVSRYTLLASTTAAAAAVGSGSDTASVSTSAPSLFVRTLSRLFTITRGDIVLCSNPLRAQHSIAKRVIGLPGDLVRATLDEPTSVCCVPVGHVWLQGDCLEASRDSREYGAVPLELVRGKVVARVWPMSRAKWIERTLQYRGY